jgi:hypothetical protein
MRSLLAVLLCAAAPDGGSLRDGGVPDAGRDAGVVDAGVPDAGPRVGSWKTFDGYSWFDDAGTTDLVTLPVGASVEVRFPQPTISVVCDDLELVRVEGQVESYRFTGLKRGQTHCGFWYEKRAWPSRYVEVTVVP